MYLQQERTCERSFYLLAISQKTNDICIEFVDYSALRNTDTEDDASEDE